MLITVTEGAKEQLKNILSAANVSDPELALRVAPAGEGQFGFITDKEREGDHIVEYEGSKVLLIGAELTDIFKRVTIDCKDTPQGPNLVVSCYFT